jgi:hypothetical protein
MDSPQLRPRRPLVLHPGILHGNEAWSLAITSADEPGLAIHMMRANISSCSERSFSRARAALNPRLWSASFHFLRRRRSSDLASVTRENVNRIVVRMGKRRYRHRRIQR